MDDTNEVKGLLPSPKDTEETQPVTVVKSKRYYTYVKPTVSSVLASVRSMGSKHSVLPQHNEILKRFNHSRLKRRCQMSIKDYVLERAWTRVGDSLDGMYIYDRHIAKPKVLAVAHLDHVANNKYLIKNTDQWNVAICGALDDRLGAYILLDLLPKFGVEYDLLLTEGEESGRSTAKWFVDDYLSGTLEEKPEYNWIFSFDRRGDDVVLYHFSDVDWESAIEESGFDLGWGSVSDISYMTRMGIKAMNVGCGYHNEHSNMSYVWIEQTASQVAMFINFYNANKDTLFEHDPRYDRWHGVYHYNGYKAYNSTASRYPVCYSDLYGYDYDKEWKSEGAIQKHLWDNDQNRVIKPDSINESVNGHKLAYRACPLCNEYSVVSYDYGKYIMCSSCHVELVWERGALVVVKDVCDVCGTSHSADRSYYVHEFEANMVYLCCEACATTFSGMCNICRRRVLLSEIEDNICLMCWSDLTKDERSEK